MQCCHGNYLCATDNDSNQQPVLDCPPSESAIVLSCTAHSSCSAPDGPLTSGPLTSDCPYCCDFTLCVLGCVKVYITGSDFT